MTADSQVSVDTSITHSGHGSGLMRGLSEEDFVNLRQGIRPDSFRGRRVRFSGYVGSELVTGTAGLWMRGDGEGMASGTAFDNMNNRAIQGTTPWTRYDIVLDVAQEATAIVLGVLMVGKGRVWLDDISLEIVDLSVPSTDMTKALPRTGAQHSEDHLTPEEKEKILATRRAAPVQLRNPGFEQRR